jgi:hypothetical protein
MMRRLILLMALAIVPGCKHEQPRVPVDNNESEYDQSHPNESRRGPAATPPVDVPGSLAPIA